MKDLKGTNFITGLNVGKAPHVIEDHELTRSVNGWTDQEGSWKTIPSSTTLYSGYSAISCLAEGSIDGTNYLVWMDGNNVYRNGTNVGSFVAGSQMQATHLSDSFLFTGASEMYLYEEGLTHELGGPQLNEITRTGIWSIAPISRTVTSITAATSAVLTVASTLSTSVGEYVYLTGVTDMPDINNRTIKVTATSGSGPFTYTLDVDTSSYGSDSTSGTAYGGACGLTGDYKYYVVPVIRFTGGYKLYGRPRGLRREGFWSTLGEDDSWEAETISLTATDGIAIRARFLWLDGGTATYKISGTRGVDYNPGLLLYRTKADGSDIYLEREWWHGDSDFTFVSATDDYYYTNSYNGGPMDLDLGVVWDATTTGRYTPPTGKITAVVGQRVYNAVGNTVYWSDLDNQNYWSPTNGVNFTDTITAMGQVRGKLAVFSDDRLWLMSLYDGLPDIIEIDTPVGTTLNKAMVTTDAGLLFLRNDGLWMFDGVSVKNIARRAFLSLASPACICASGDTIYLSGSTYCYTARIRDGGIVWHSGTYVGNNACSSSGDLYMATGTDIYKLFQGDPGNGEFETKFFGGLDETKQYRIVVDVEGEGSVYAKVEGVRQSGVTALAESNAPTDGRRRLARFPVPRLANSHFSATISVIGDIVVYGYRVEVER